MSRNKGNGSTVSTAIGFLIANALLIVGLYGVYTLWFQPYHQFQKSESWDSVSCTVTKITVEDTPHTADSAVYTPSVEYAYQRNGREYSSERFWFGAKGTSDKNIATQAAGAFQANGLYECLVSPLSPSDAVLVRKLNPAAGSTLRNYMIAAGIGAIMWLGHAAGFMMTLMRGTATMSEKNLKLAMANGTCPVESGEPDEPLVIQAAETRVAVAVGLWIAGICWTGIVSLIGLAVVQNKDWFPMLILSVFLLVGIALLVFAFYSTLQIFNPRPILACSQRDLYPGSEFELSWMFRGDAKKIKHLEIVLEGIEKVSYRQGTSTRTEEKPFFRQSVVDSPTPDFIAQGFELVSIPVATMHSFKSSNNSFTWQIRVLGKIAFWPDIRDRFEIVLLAPKPDGLDG